MINTPRSRASTLEEVAYHEAGHVVIGHRLGVDLASADILPDGQGGNGHTVFNVRSGFRDHPDYILPLSEIAATLLRLAQEVPHAQGGETRAEHE